VELYSTLCYETSNALFTLVETKQDCLQKLFKTVKTTCGISEFMTVRPAMKKSPTAVLK